MKKDYVIDALWEKTFRQGEKKSQKIGFEWEILGFEQESHRRIDYQRLTSLFNSFLAKGWQGIYEQDRLVGAQAGEAFLTLEPGGQFEYSSPVFADLQEAQVTLTDFIQELRRLSAKLGIVWVTVGFDPFSKLADVPRMPKERYKIMHRRLHKGTTRNMMYSSAAFQVVLDYSSEEDMHLKLLAGQYLSPLALALFATSPFESGQKSLFNCYRGYVWEDVSPLTAGFIKDTFRDKFSYRDYIKLALDTPMLTVERQGVPQDAMAINFYDFWHNGLNNLKPENADWDLHLCSVFTFARLKQIIELRAADAGNLQHNLAQTAFFVGLFYHKPNLEKLAQKALSMGIDELHTLMHSAVVDGLSAKSGNHQLLELATEALTLAEEGLNQQDPEHTKLLAPIATIIKKNKNISSQLLEACMAQPKASIFDILKEFDLVFP